MPRQTTGLLSKYLQRKRLCQVEPFIKGKVLDFGCGTGELCRYVTPELYWGTDVDAETLSYSRQHYPKHRFDIVENTLSTHVEYDSIILSAVIEHVDEPAALLTRLSMFLAKDGIFIITTPHPLGHMPHKFGSFIGLFSKEAHHEHKELLDHDKLENIANTAGLRIDLYSRFLFGLNQLVVLTHHKQHEP